MSMNSSSDFHPTSPSPSPSPSPPRSQAQAQASDLHHASNGKLISQPDPQFPLSSVHVEKSESVSTTPSKPISISSASVPFSFSSLVHEIAFISIVTMSQLLTQAGLAQGIVPAQAIAVTFNITDAGTLAWFPAGYSLTVGTFILISGRLADMYGDKPVVIGGFAWFGLWSMIAGLSSYSGSVEFFIICRALEGIGPAFVLPTSVAILGRTYKTGRRKNVVFSIFAASAPSGFVIGACFSSLLVKQVQSGWEWSYYIMAITCGLCAASAYFVIPADSQHDKEERKKREVKFDWFGTATGLTGLVLVNIAWNQAPAVGWDTTWIWVVLLLGVLIFCLFIFIELTPAWAPQPLLPRDIFSREIALVLCCIACGWSSFGILTYYQWQFLTLLRDYTPLLATAAFSPVSFSGAAASVVSGVLLGEIASGLIMMISMCAFLAGSILLATESIDQTYWSLSFVFFLVTPFGMDMSFPAANVISSDFVSKEHQGTAASLVNTVLNYSISIGLGIAGTVQYYTSDITDMSQDAMFNRFRSTFYVAIGLSGLGVICSLILTVDTHFANKKKHTGDKGKGKDDQNGESEGQKKEEDGEVGEKKQDDFEQRWENGGTTLGVENEVEVSAVHFHPDESRFQRG